MKIADIRDAHTENKRLLDINLKLSDDIVALCNSRSRLRDENGKLRDENGKLRDAARNVLKENRVLSAIIERLRGDVAVLSSGAATDTADECRAEAEARETESLAHRIEHIEKRVWGGYNMDLGLTIQGKLENLFRGSIERHKRTRDLADESITALSMQMAKEIESLRGQLSEMRGLIAELRGK
jgi:hypothetical protein